MNLFEGKLSVDERDHAVIASPELETPVFLDHGVTGAHGAGLWVAIRPEKIELHKRSRDGSRRRRWRMRRRATTSSPG